jgi:sterol desaturase/sphingolipid hydroxylase (fatty acid hydroxylase superfamily)
MLFSFYSTLGIASIAIVLATALIIWSMQNKQDGHFLAKGVGVIIFIISLFSILCSSFSGAEYLITGISPKGTSMDVHLTN